MMRKRTTITGQIEQLIEERSGAPICDDCITDHLNLSVRSQANVVTRELGKQETYDREKLPAKCAGPPKRSLAERVPDREGDYRFSDI